MTESPPHFALYAVLAGVVLALAVVAAGAFGVVSQSRKLKRRLDEVATLPFLPTLDLTAARLDIANRQLNTLPVLEARARRALQELQTARTQIASAFGNARDAVRTLVTGR